MEIWQRLRNALQAVDYRVRGVPLSDTLKELRRQKKRLAKLKTVLGGEEYPLKIYVILNGH